MTKTTDPGLAYLEPLQFRTMHEAYPFLRDLILDKGHKSSPRGEATTEVLGASFVIEDAVGNGVPVGTGRKVGKKMMAIDGTSNLSGYSYPDVAIRVAPVLERFADTLEPSTHLTKGIVYTANAEVGGKFFQGAYGPRIGAQLERVETQLRRDPDTRQAVVSLWREEDANPFWKDRPCTTEFQLMIRDGKLEIFVFMRANDLWTGTCYDVFQFGQIQAAMAHVLGLETGPYHHYATSLHIYDRDVEKFDAVVPWVTDELSGELEPAIANPRETAGPNWSALAPGEYTSWHEVRDRFAQMLDCLRMGQRFISRNHVEGWYWQIMNVDGI